MIEAAEAIKQKTALQQSRCMILVVFYLRSADLRKLLNAFPTTGDFFDKIPASSASLTSGTRYECSWMG
jgi:hypothetical protein